MEQKLQFTSRKAGMGDAPIEVKGSDDLLLPFFLLSVDTCSREGRGMKTFGLAVLGGTCFACVSATNVAMAQSASDLVGTWQLVSAVNMAKDGTKSDVFGPNPKGMMMFGPDGHFVQVLTRPGLPKFAAENRLRGTPDENKAIVQGSIAMYGMYSVSDKTLVLHVESGTWPSWTGTDQKRPLTSFTGNELVWTLQASVGGTNVTTFRRAK